MRLDEIPLGAEVFIDANIFIYHFTGGSKDCTEFLSKCEKGDLVGITSIIVLLEVLHRLMMVEAVIKNIIKPPNIAKKLKKYPEKVKELEDYYINTQKIIEMGITLDLISYKTILKSHAVRRKKGLMINDSIIVASMQERNIQSIATNDKSFLKVDALNVYSPVDL